jgi:hypothetical protein
MLSGSKLVFTFHGQKIGDEKFPLLCACERVQSKRDMGQGSFGYLQPHTVDSHVGFQRFIDQKYAE